MDPATISLLVGLAASAIGAGVNYGKNRKASNTAAQQAAIDARKNLVKPENQALSSGGVVPLPAAPHALAEDEWVRMARNLKGKV